MEHVYYSPILHGCMNTRKGEEKFKNFRILLDSGCISTIIMGGGPEKGTKFRFFVRPISIGSHPYDTR